MSGISFSNRWHAFPNTMRWVDTALPNPDTFTASLRRLDQRGMIQRIGKQQRRWPRTRFTCKDGVRCGPVRSCEGPRRRGRP